MKKSLCVAAVAALFCASSVMAATLEVRVVDGSESDTHNNDGSAETVTVLIQARLDSGTPTTDGLAIIGCNLKPSVSGAAVLPDLCDTSGFLVVSPPDADMDEFDRANPFGGPFNNKGLTNPSASANLSGYSGTCDGSDGLLQIGGGTNTIGNTPGGAPYPIGAVPIDVGNTTWKTIATGDIDVPAGMSGSDEIILTLDTCFANTIDNHAGGSPYAVTEVASGSISVTALTINAGVLCSPNDVNCDGFVNATDIGLVGNGANFQVPSFPCDRADVNTDGFANATDIGIIGNGAIFQKNPTGPCICITATPGPGGPCAIP